MFSELSFEGATTREIVARAEVTQPLLNYHFSSKDELWRAAVDRLFKADLFLARVHDEPRQT